LQIMLANRTFAHTVWFHNYAVSLKLTLSWSAVLSATNPEGSEDMNENKAQVLIKKKTAINLLEAFAVATKHYLRGEPGIYYVDLYHLVKFLPAYALPLTRTSTFDVPGAITSPPVSNHNINTQATTSPPPRSLILHKPTILRQLIIIDRNHGTCPRRFSIQKGHLRGHMVSVARE